MKLAKENFVRFALLLVVFALMTSVFACNGKKPVKNVSSGSGDSEGNASGISDIINSDQSGSLISGSVSGSGLTSTGASSGIKVIKPSNTDAANTNKTGFPIVKKPITLKVCSLIFPYEKSFDKMEFLQQYEKKTNVKINWELWPSSDLQAVNEKKMLQFQSGQLPDVYMLGGMLNDQDVITYADAGWLRNISEFMDYAPNFAQRLKQYPWIKKSITAPNGKIYSMPSVDVKKEGHGFYSFKLYINKKWLDNLMLDVPKTTTDLINVLTKFKDEDANNNGNKNDEIPLSLYEFSPTFAVAPYGGPCYYYNNNYMTVDNNNKIVYGPSTNAFKLGLRFMNQLYKSKLLDQDFGDLSYNGWKSKVNAGKVGMFMSFADFLDVGLDNHDYIMIEPINAPGYSKTWSYFDSARIQATNWVVTSSCKSPEAAVRWGDYFWSTEGELNGLYGPEGRLWKSASGGKWENLGDANKPRTLNKQQWLGTMTPGYMLPIFYSQENYDNAIKTPYEKMPAYDKADYNLNQDVIKCYSKYKPKYTLPYLLLSSAENDKVNEYIKGIDTIYVKYLFNCIKGETPVDGTWDGYIESLSKAKLSEVVGAYQSAYTRYQNVK